MNRIFAQQRSAEELREQIRTSVQDQIRTAQTQTGRVTVTTPDGKTMTIDRPEVLPTRVNDGNITAAEARELLRGMDVPPRAESLGYALLLTFASVIILGPLARAWARRINVRSAQPQIPAQVTAQLTQLTQAVDSIAIEVERISEGQRFTTKLLAEQHKLAAKELSSS